MFRNTLYRFTNVISRQRVFSAAAASTTRSNPKVAALAAAAGGTSDRVVVLGGGWAGFQIALDANKDLPLTVISPNNHFVFTPLLASTAVGTLEFRCIQEPIRTVLGPEGRFIQAKARSLDPDKKMIICESVHNDIFELEYDKLVIAVGVQTNVSCFCIFENTAEMLLFSFIDFAW
jgi:NADPH-dependent 2,4-dienoyl-CoA reductase/sulfur reductase-like enzyme